MFICEMCGQSTTGSPRRLVVDTRPVKYTEKFTRKVKAPFGSKLIVEHRPVCKTKTSKNGTKYKSSTQSTGSEIVRELNLCEPCYTGITKYPF